MGDPERSEFDLRLVATQEISSVCSRTAHAFTGPLTVSASAPAPSWDGPGLGGRVVRTKLRIRRDPPQVGEAKQREDEHHGGADEGADRGDAGDHAHGPKA
jgi:hypothetical protein